MLTQGSDPTDAFLIRCERPWLVAQFSRPQRMASWSLNRPGLVTASAVAWLEVRDSDFIAGVDPAAWFQERLGEADLADAVGMMTARNVATFVDRTAHIGDIRARCIVTLGLNNGERIGTRARPPALPSKAGTINILCHVSSPLSDAATLEAASIVTQARTVALVEVGYRRPEHLHTVTGTGTDCVIMASPAGPAPADYAGMHTEIGEAVGACVLSATEAALQAWLAERTR